MVKKNREMTEIPAVYTDLKNQETSNYASSSPNQRQKSLDFEELSAVLNKVCEQEYMMGYILRDNVKATINLKDSAKIIDFAMLSSQAFESAAELSASFKLGNVGNIIIEGTDIKVLCVNVGKNIASIFMEKTADHIGILDKIALT